MIQYGQLHAAGDVYANRIGNHGVVTSEDATDRQPVTNMRIGHQGSGRRHRDATGLPHLRMGVGLDAFCAPSPIRNRFGPHELAVFDKRIGKIAKLFVVDEFLRVIQHGLNLAFHVLPFCTSRPGDPLNGRNGLLNAICGYPQLLKLATVHGFFTQA